MKSTASPWRRLPLAVAAGVLLAAGFPPIHLPAFLPLGVALLIAALEESSHTIRHYSYLGLAAGLVFYGITLPWLFNLFGSAAISLLFVAAFFPMLFSGLYVFLRRRYSAVPPWLLASLVWTGVEYFRSELFWLSFGWMGLGYATMGNVLFGAAASTVGSYGITFAIVAIGASLAVSPLPKPAHRVFAVALTLMWLTPFAVQFVIPISHPLPNNPISVRLVQAAGGDEQEAIRLSDRAEAPPVDVIVWPEYLLLEDPTRNPKLMSKLEDVARRHHAWFIFGGEEQIGPSTASKYHNTAFVLDPSGAIAGKHYKNHTVHFVKDGVRGTEAAPVQSSLGLLGVAICFDMDYPDVARKLVQQGAAVLLIPNMDPPEWGELQRTQHRLMFQMRAAECGRWLARADVAGGTSVAAPNGEEVERIGTAQPASMDVIVGREQGQTLYVRGGWAFGPATFWLTVAAVVAGWARDRKRKSGVAAD